MTTSPSTLPHPATTDLPKAGTPQLWRPLLAAVALTGLLGAVAFQPAQAQVVNPLGNVRNFPEAAQRGTLTIVSVQEAKLNSRDIRMAPGMRLFSPQNNLVMLHNVTGQSFKVNYLIENSTGMLLSAWILTQGEAAQPRKGSDATPSNITTGSGAVVN